MISRKRAWCVHLLPLVIVVFNSGCGIIRHCANSDAKCLLRTRSKSVAPGLVEVGGQVRQPSRLEIPSTGLTLRRALMSVGGSQEPSAASSSPADVDFASNLTNVVLLASNNGKIDGRSKLLVRWKLKAEMEVPPNSQAIVKIVAELESLKPQLSKGQEELERVISSLPSSANKKIIGSLAFQCKTKGEREAEREALKDKDLPKGVIAFSEEALTEKIDEANASISNLLSDLSKSTSEGGSQLLVALENSTAISPVTYYFPYDLVLASAAGEIKLQDGDVVSVIPIRSTELSPELSGSVTDVSDVIVHGYVKPVPEPVITTIGSIGDQYERTIADPRSVWMLVRPAPNGVGHRVFVLPDYMVKTNGAASTALAQSGDEYTYLILPQIPVVLESLLVERLHSTNGRRVDRLRASASAFGRRLTGRTSESSSTRDGRKDLRHSARESQSSKTN